jgi:RimJ/RimL family protein N-acetyltransferase
MEARIEVVTRLEDADTERLHLRRFREDDLDALSVVFAKPEVWKFPYGRGMTRVETEAFLKRQIAEWETNGFGCWLAIERHTQRIIGYLGLSIPTFLPEVLPAVEVGWRLDPDVWRMGYATEGASKALEEGFERLGLEEICSIPQSGNPDSEAVCRRLGMRWQRSVDVPANKKRGPLRAEFYALTKSEWRDGCRCAVGATTAE